MATATLPDIQAKVNGVAVAAAHEKQRALVGQDPWTAVTLCGTLPLMLDCSTGRLGLESWPGTRGS